MHQPGIEPGPPRWQRGILTVRPLVLIVRDILYICLSFLSMVPLSLHIRRKRVYYVYNRENIYIRGRLVESAMKAHGRKREIEKANEMYVNSGMCVCLKRERERIKNENGRNECIFGLIFRLLLKVTVLSFFYLMQ